jgi:hypothetical protein
MSGRQIHLYRQALTNELQLSRNNVNLIKTRNGKPKADQISAFYPIDRGWATDSLERMYLWDINPNYIWRGGIMRCLEAGTYIFYGNQCPDIERVYIPSGDLSSTLYYDNEHVSFSLEQGDFMVHPLPECTMLMTKEDIDLFILEYVPFHSDPGNVDGPDYNISVSMAMKQFNFIKQASDYVWSPVHLSNL